MTELHDVGPHLLAFVELAPVGLALLDRDLRVSYMNSHLATLLGVQQGHRVRVSNLFPWDLRPQVEECLRLVLVRGDRFGPAGLGSSLTISCVPLWGDEGVAGLGLTVLHSPRGHERKETLRRLEERLDRVNRLEAMGRLTAKIVHDFRNDLTSILGHCDFLAHAELDEPLREDALRIRAGALRAIRLVEQLSTFGRPHVPDPRLLDLNSVVADLESMLRRVIEESITLVVRPAVGLWATRADLDQLQLLIVNLALGARDTMPSGGEVVIETLNVAAPGGAFAGEYVGLRVTETGRGLADEAQAGPGVAGTCPAREHGLATIRRIVGQLGGRVEAHGSPGRGSSSLVLLPRADVGPPASALSSDQLGIAGGWETVLVVGDDGALRDLTQQALSAYGYTVLTAGDAAEAALADEAFGGPIDLLVSDVALPGPTGPQLFAELRRRHPGLRVLYVSGHSDGALAGHGVPARTPLLRQPLSAAALAREVRSVLDGRGIDSGRRPRAREHP